MVLKNKLGEMWKCIQPCLIHIHKVFNMISSEKHCLRFLQLILYWRSENELKHCDQSCEHKYEEIEKEIYCNVKKDELYLYIYYEELQNFNLFQSSEEKHNAELSIINPNLLDLDLEVSDSMSIAPDASTIIDCLLLPNEQFYELSICSIS